MSWWLVTGGGGGWRRHLGQNFLTADVRCPVWTCVGHVADGTRWGVPCCSLEPSTHKSVIHLSLIVDVPCVTHLCPTAKCSPPLPSVPCPSVHAEPLLCIMSGSGGGCGYRHADWLYSVRGTFSVTPPTLCLCHTDRVMRRTAVRV